MHKFVLALALSAAFATPAVAEPFSGPYIGAEVGLDNYEGQADDLFATGDAFDGISANGIVGGVFAGYDYAAGNAFFGIEAKASLSDAEASYDDTVDALDIRAKESFGASVRGGVMVNDSTGLYARAGWANTKFKVNINGTTASDSDDGLVLGAGLETRVGSAASLRVEYVRSDYNDFIKNNAVLAGVAYRF
jgi:outer membrane immunogenic protein